MYIKTDGGTTILDPEYSIQKLMKDIYPTTLKNGITDEELAAEFNMHRVYRADKPNFNDRNQYLKASSELKLVNGRWERGWTVENLTDKQKRERAVSAARGKARRAGGALSPEDRLGLLAAYLEYQDYRTNPNAQTPMLDKMRAEVFPGENKMAIGVMVENAAMPFIEAVAVSIGERIKGDL